MKYSIALKSTGVAVLCAGAYLVGRNSQSSAVDGSRMTESASDFEPNALRVQPPNAQASAPLEVADRDSQQRSELSDAVLAALPAKAPAVEDPDVSAEVLTWREKYGHLSHRELASQRHALRTGLAELSAPAFDEYLMRGDYEVVGVGQPYKPESWDNSQLSQVRVPSDSCADQRVLKIVLRESDYPQLLAMHRESHWMEIRLNELLSMRPSDARPK